MPQPEVVERHYETVEGLKPHYAEDPPASPRPGLEAIVSIPASLPSPELVSSAHGKLGEMLLAIPKYATVDPLGAVYRDLLGKLPARCELLVATHESTAEQVERWISDANPDPEATIVSLPDNLIFSVWAEDSWVAARDRRSGEVYLLEPYEFRRYADTLILNEISRPSGRFNSRRTPLYFEGGNLLVGDDFFMIGADYPARSLGYMGTAIHRSPQENDELAVRRLYGEYLDGERELVVIGSRIPVPTATVRDVEIDGEPWKELLYAGNKKNTKQPLFHIDMFITLAGRDERGKYRVLVGDPGMATETLGNAPWPHAMQDVFDDIAEQLDRLGFGVVRNPLPLAYMDNSREKVRTWYFATANNALVEIDKDARRVWLPSYGHARWKNLERTDTRNCSIWEDLGFDVTLLGDFHPLAENLGAVHCIKKYLARG